MAAKKYTNKAERAEGADQSPFPPVPGKDVGIGLSPAIPGPVLVDPFTTGNSVVVFRDYSRTSPAGLQRLIRVAGFSPESVARSTDYERSAMDLSDARDADIKVFEQLGVAVIRGVPDQTARVTALAADDSEILMVVPERFYFHADDQPAPGGDQGLSGSLSLDYIQGRIDALEEMKRRLGGGEDASSSRAEVAAVAFQDDAQSTWGLRATKVLNTALTGRGIRVAILDSGIDMTHPDFSARLNPANCVGFDAQTPNSDARDINGHGTHVAGTACGNRVTVPNGFQGRRYGVAPEADLFIARIFPNATDLNILAAINWAVTQQCHVVNMSFETPVLRCDQQDPYNFVGRRSLDAGTLLIAAAGNKMSVRSAGRIGPVASPASSPFILAVGALDQSLRIADFSPASVCPNQAVDIVAPGVQVFSSWPMAAGGYNIIPGTSMAAPHVTGIAALISQANNGARGRDLWRMVVGAANQNNLGGSAPFPLQPARDFGFGLAVLNS